ncbi:MAG: RidA family protein, partial [Pseudomonadota bacterium]
MIKSITPARMAPPFARYAHGVADEDSGLVLTSGQLALEVDGSIPDDAETQAHLIFKNIDKILSDAGTSKAGVLRINAYVTDRRHMAGYMMTYVKTLTGAALALGAAGAAQAE